MKLERGFLSFRVGVHQWLRDERFDGLRRFFDKYRGAADEITFFLSETHAPLPLEVTRRLCEILAQRMETMRESGYRSGINILATIGHHEENLANSLDGDYTRMTDIEGTVCRGSFCPNDQRFLDEYVRPVYKALVSAGPDYIWIDDDVRLSGHMPISGVCLCDNCLTIFEREFGTRYTRESLKAAFSTGLIEDKLSVRRRWLQHNRNTIGNLLGFIERVVHEMSRKMPLGFMDGIRFYEGFDMAGWAGLLSGPGGAPVMWRPGGGTYTEEIPDQVAFKAHAVGLEAAALPEQVVQIQSELESFSYQRLKKSEHFTALESATYIAAGATGTAYNVLSMHNEPLEDYESLAARLQQLRPFLDLLVSHFGRIAPTGVYTGWCEDSYATGDLDGENWITAPGGLPGLFHADEIFKIGIPVAYSADKAVVTALAGDSVRALSRQEVRRIMSGGVYMDGRALDGLNEMGYGDLTGFRVVGRRERDTIEQMVENELNGEVAGRYRDGRQSFWKCTAHVLAPTSDNTRPLSRLVDYAYNEIAPCGSGVSENELGGRICVAGYYPWQHLQYRFKADQLKSIFRWLSRDSLPAYIASYHRIALWDRILEDGRQALALLNMYLDPARDVELLLSTDSDSLAVYSMDCSQQDLEANDTDGLYRRFVIPELKPWAICLAVTRSV